MVFQRTQGKSTHLQHSKMQQTTKLVMMSYLGRIVLGSSRGPRCQRDLRMKDNIGCCWWMVFQPPTKTAHMPQKCEGSMPYFCGLHALCSIIVPLFRGFEKGLVDRGGWSEGNLPMPEIRVSFLYHISNSSLRRRWTKFWVTIFAAFGALSVANPLPPTPFSKLLIYFQGP